MVIVAIFATRNVTMEAFWTPICASAHAHRHLLGMGKLAPHVDVCVSMVDHLMQNSVLAVAPLIVVGLVRSATLAKRNVSVEGP